MVRLRVPLLVLSSDKEDGGDRDKVREGTKIGVDGQDMVWSRDRQIKAA